MIEIALTGTESTGKTTYAGRLKEAGEQMGLKVIIAEEVARKVLDGVSSMHEITFDQQYEIYAEEVRRRYVYRDTDADIVVFDRTLLDNIAYAMFYREHKFNSTWDDDDIDFRISGMGMGLVLMMGYDKIYRFSRIFTGRGDVDMQRAIEVDKILRRTIYNAIPWSVDQPPEDMLREVLK